MNEEQVVDVEAQEVTENEAPEATPSPLAEVLEETVKLFDLIGRAMLTTAQDVTKRVSVPMDPELREHLDLLVESGAARTRNEAARLLLDEGIDVKSPLFDRIRKTQFQIHSLREQLRSLVNTKAV